MILLLKYDAKDEKKIVYTINGNLSLIFRSQTDWKHNNRCERERKRKIYYTLTTRTHGKLMRARLKCSIMTIQIWKYIFFLLCENMFCIIANNSYGICLISIFFFVFARCEFVTYPNQKQIDRREHRTHNVYFCSLNFGLCCFFFLSLFFCRFDHMNCQQYIILCDFKSRRIDNFKFWENIHFFIFIFLIKYVNIFKYTVIRKMNGVKLKHTQTQRETKTKLKP